MSDATVVAGAVLAVISALAAPGLPGLPPAVALLLLGVAALTRRREFVLVAVAVLVAVRAQSAVAGLERPLPARLSGVAELATDPQPDRFATRVILRLDGRRWLATFDRATEGRVRPLLTGERLWVRGVVRPLQRVPESWRRSRHLAGHLKVDRVGTGPPAAAWYRLTNGLHRLLHRGASRFDESDRALYLGLVLGDDRAQSELARSRFRASGLGHLLAVSGQNVVFVLAVAAPLTSRLPLRIRWVVGVAVLAGFVLLTRAEPSVLRATVMAAVALAATTAGRLASGARVLALAVLVLLVADPLLVHSLGFRLSVAATAGLLGLARPLAAVLAGPAPVATALATTLSAQLGTIPFLLGVSGGVPAASIPANLLAVPAAGAVMVLGLTVGPLAGLIRPGPASYLQVPAGLLIDWVSLVATVASRLPLGVLDGPRCALLAVTGAVLVLSRRWAGSIRWALAVLGVVACALIVAPVTPGPGRHRVASDAVLEVDACGARTLVLGPSPRTGAVLDGLWRRGVRSVATVSTTAPQGGPVATEVAEELDARVVSHEGSGPDRPCGEGRVASPP